MHDVKEIKKRVQDLNILFVDDEEEIQLTAGAFLRKFFDNVIICHDGIEGIETLKNNPSIDIVIADIQMPKMDGISMVEQMREIKPGIFVTFVTATRDKDIRLDNMNHLYITKPVTYESIIEFLEEVMNKLNR